MSRSNVVAVLDIGSKSVTALIGEKVGGNLSSVKGTGEYAYQGFSQGEWFDVPGLKNAVRAALNIAEVEAGVKVKKLYVGIPSEFLAVATKIIAYEFKRPSRIGSEQIDALFNKGDDFEKTAPGFSSVNCSAIYYVLDDNPKRIIEPRGFVAKKVTAELSYVLCEKDFLNLFDGLAEELGLKEIEYIPEAWAEAMGLLRPEQRYRYAVIVDVGYITGSVAAIKGDGLLSLSSFSQGGGHIAGDISVLLNLPFEVAEKVQSKLDLNLNYSEEEYFEVTGLEGEPLRISAKDAKDIAFARLDSIANIIRQAFEIDGKDCPEYAAVYLTGGGLTEIRGAKEYLSASLNRPIEVLTSGLPRFDKPALASTMALFETASKLSQQRKYGFIKKLLEKIGG